MDGGPPESGSGPSTPDRLLIIAPSGRALAASARRAGYRCDVIDEFADADTRRLAGFCTVAAKLDRTSLQPLLAQWKATAGGEWTALITGGIEREPGLVDWLAHYARPAANAAAVIRRVKQPRALAMLLLKLAIPHPTVMTGNAAGDLSGEWLQKRIGGEGGGHVRPWRGDTTPGPDEYLQRRVSGQPASVVFLGDGQAARVVGYNRCLLAGAQTGRPDDFRFAGVLRWQPGPALRGVLDASVTRLVTATGLRGLCGADLVIGPTTGSWYMLEVNPRPPASFELHEHGGNLVQAHLDACAGRLPPDWPSVPGCSGKLVVYADRTAVIPEGLVWPGWAADRPPAGQRIETGAPLCSVFAQAETGAACEQRLFERRNIILNYIKDTIHYSENEEESY